MAVSVLTKKWQTTIPKEIRNILHLEPNDKILYQVEGQKVVLKPLKGNILELRGSIKTKESPADFEKIMETTKKKVAGKIAEQGK